jgi:hypothetical protein
VSLHKGTILKGMLPKLKSSKYILVYRSSLGNFLIHQRILGKVITSKSLKRRIILYKMDLEEIGSDMDLTVPKSYQTAVLIFTSFYLLHRTCKIRHLYSELSCIQYTFRRYKALAFVCFLRMCIFC